VHSLEEHRQAVAVPVLQQAAGALTPGGAAKISKYRQLVCDVRVRWPAGRDEPVDTPGVLVIVRADSAYFNHDVVAAARRGGARVSITARMNPAVLRAIAGIKESAWTPIHYPNAIWDEQDQRLVSDAQVAEVPFTAFTSRTKAEHVDGRLIVRRVKRLNRASVPSNQGEQGELFATYRHHAIFTDTTLEMLQAETTHRGHAIIEQVHADLRAGPLAHLPSSSFSANGAWLVLAAIAFNLTRAAGAIASVFSRQGHHRHHP